MARTIAAARNFFKAREAARAAAPVAESSVPAACTSPLGNARPLAELLANPDLLNPPPRLPSTYAALDKALHGGLVLGGMYVVAALTGRVRA